MIIANGQQSEVDQDNTLNIQVNVPLRAKNIIRPFQGQSNLRYNSPNENDSLN